MNYNNAFSAAQILPQNPILRESFGVRAGYYCYLERMMQLAQWDQEKYTQAELAFYRESLYKNIPYPNRGQAWQLYIPIHNHLIPFDVAALLGFHSDYPNFTEKTALLRDQYAKDFGLTKGQAAFFTMVVRAATSKDSSSWNKLLRGADKLPVYYMEYLLAARDNANFVNRQPLRILVTATMSAGKSTLINALTGKRISKTQNLACTSKVHVILSKPFEDNCVTEYDSDISLAATQEELLTDNEENPSNQITVSTYFQSGLGGQRILLLDTPGVNSSENAEHTEITQSAICSKQYDMLLYVLNATQLRTTDDQEHLHFIAENCKDKQIIFVLNKADQLFAEEENLTELLRRQYQYLESLGFTKPLLFPVSAKAACLAQKSAREPLNRIERRELDNYIYDFSQMNFIGWDEELFHRVKIPPIPCTYEETWELLRDCGFAYLEEYLKCLARSPVL